MRGALRSTPGPIGLLALATTIACNDRGGNARQEDTLWLDITGSGSVITAATGEADLVQRFGTANVRPAEIDYAEGYSAPGTILFPTDSTRTMEIVWHDTTARARPDFLRVGAHAARWVLSPGVRIGTTLPELERLNGRPFVLTGADPNTGGFTVLSWEGGRLASLSAAGTRVWIQLAAGNPDSVPAELEGSEGEDRKLSSTHALVRQLQLRVDEITVGFENLPVSGNDTTNTRETIDAGPLAIVARHFREESPSGREPAYEITAEYPQLTGSSTAAVVAFNTMVRALVDTLTAGMREAATEPGGAGGEVHVDYTIELASDDFVSVHFTHYFRYTAAGQSNAISRAVNWDIRRGRRLTLDDLFTSVERVEPVLATSALRELQRIHKDDSWATEERLMQSVRHVVGDEDKWLIGKTGLVLVFDSAEIGPPGAGATTVTVPYTVLNSLLRQDGALASLVL